MAGAEAGARRAATIPVTAPMPVSGTTPVAVSMTISVPVPGRTIPVAVSGAIPVAVSGTIPVTATMAARIGQFRARVLVHHFHGQAHFAALVNLQQFDLDHLALARNVGHPLHATRRKL